MHEVWHSFYKPTFSRKKSKKKFSVFILKKTLSLSIHLFSQICYHVKSAECKHIKGTTHNVQKFSLPAYFWKIGPQKEKMKKFVIILKYELKKCYSTKMCSKIKLSYAEVQNYATKAYKKKWTSQGHKIHFFCLILPNCIILMLIQSCSKIFINIPWDIKKYYFINELHVKTGNWNRKFFKYLVDIITH